MKNFKKGLSLVLVLVMVLGLVGSAFAGFESYTDADKITETYAEATDYLIAAGVIVGNGDGTLKPTDNLTRNQAAKLIAYAMIGENAAERLKAAEDPFDDVPADNWAAGYISYCAAQGIVHGDGTFRELHVAENSAGVDALVYDP